MKNSLDFSTKEFKEILDKSSQLVLNQFEKIHDRKGYHDLSQSEVQGWFDEPIPKEGISIDELFQFVEEKILNPATGNIGPNMYAYVMGGGNQMGIIGDKLAATVNQNVTKWHLAPVMTEIDKRVIQWASEMIGFGENVGGFIGSSGSSANLDGLTVARNIFFEKLGIRKKGLFGQKPFVVYCSKETHSSIDKSIELLGIGTDHLIKIETHSDYTIDISSLEKQIETDIENGLQPFCIVGNAGTVNTGAIDDLLAMSIIAQKYDLWFHVDGCYGGLAASLDTKKHLYKGLELADSVALDFHKWLYQPFEIGCLLVKGWSYMNRSYFKQASYLDKSLEKEDNRLELNEHHFLLSRNAKSLKAWMTIKTFGIKLIKEMIQKDIDLTDYLNEEINRSEDFELVADSPLAVSCFRYKAHFSDQHDIVQINKELIPALEKDGRVFITGTKLNDEFVLRACLINHRKNKASTRYLLQVIREVGQEVLSSKGLIESIWLIND